jgi:hypothetical protein
LDIEASGSNKKIDVPQASVPSINFTSPLGRGLASISEESDSRGLKFASLYLKRAENSSSTSMNDKLWINDRGELMFGSSPLGGWWTLQGTTLTFPTGLMVIGTPLNPASTPVLNVLGRATLKSLKLTDGNEGDGKVLVSDANGVGSWQDFSSGGSIDELFDGKTTQSALYLGLYAGENDNPESSSKNVGVGFNSLTSADNDVLQNTAVGYYTMQAFSFGLNNTAVGFEALTGGDTGPPAGGDENTAIGSGALRNNSSGSGNVAIGFEAGKNSSGDDKLYIHNSDAGDFSLIYGDFDSAELTINGKLRVTQGIYGNVYDPNGWPSDVRYKKNVKTISNSLEKVLKLRGVYYDWRKDEFPREHFNDRKQIGVIAQEMEKVIPEVVHIDEDGYRSVEYSKLTSILINAIQEQQEMINELKEEIGKLKDQKGITISRKK